MSDADLLFKSSPATSGDLVFGAADENPVEFAAAISGSFAGLQGSVRVTRVTFATAGGSFGGLQGAADLQYQTNTQRPVVGRTVTHTKGAGKVQNGAAHVQELPTKKPAGWAAGWQQGAAVQAGVDEVSQGNRKRARYSAAAGHAEAARLVHRVKFAHQEAGRSVRAVLAAAFEGATRDRADTAFRHQDADRTKRGAAQSHTQNARPFQHQRRGSFQPATQAWHDFDARHQNARTPPAGLSVLLPPVDPGVPSCYTPDPDLLFSWPAGYGPHLVFTCGDYSFEPPAGLVVVPVRRAYIVINDVTLRRASDDAPVNATAMSLSIDVDSWAWGFSASVPMSDQSIVESAAGPVELIASVNGTEFRVLAENIARERTFGKAGLRVTGRGFNAELGDPYAPVMTFGNDFDRTAQQLMNDALLVNGVSMGWLIDFGLTDWLVPATVFSHQGTHITALQSIAQAAGGYLLPHPNQKVIKVRHRYPAAPWQWGTVSPDFVLPSSVVTRESMEWKNRPAYNRVFVAGQVGGILAQVTRNGTAGDVMAMMVTDQLITHADAGRQRGRAILGDTGRQIAATLRLPVLPETGIIEPGKFVRYQDEGTRTGIVRSVSVDITDKAVWQSIGVEIHV